MTGPVLGRRPTDTRAAAQERRGLATIEGDLNRKFSGLARREQHLLKRDLFGRRTSADCALCGLHLPLQLVRAAHVKLRSRCSHKERLDSPHIVMPACILGCDALYEYGYLAVDNRGRILTCADGTTDDLAVALSAYEGRQCIAFSPERRKYFAWHRREVFRAR